jgi:tryptophanyl-tRNA synthetase
VEGNPVFTYLDLFDPEQEKVAEYKQAYKVGKVGDVEIKNHLAGVLNESLASLRERRARLTANPAGLLEVLRSGTRRARPLAEETYALTARKMGILELNHNFNQGEIK